MPPQVSSAEMYARSTGFNVRPWITQLEGNARIDKKLAAISLFDFDNPNVLPLVLKPSESDGKTHILRLYNPTDAKQHLNIKAENTTFALTSILEEIGKAEAKNSIEIVMAPFEIASVCVEKCPQFRLKK